MQSEQLIELVRQIQNHQCESQTHEIKSAEYGCPTKLFNTLSSFSNQNDGGIIVFGISEEQNYRIVGVYDPHDLQHRVNEQCKQMQPEVRPLFSVCEIDGSIVVSAEIPGLDISERPVFYKGKGRLSSSYIRVGGVDECMTEYEVFSLDAYRRKERFDFRVIEEANVSDFRGEEIKNYLENIKNENPNLSKFSDDRILTLCGVIKDGKPTLAGLLCFAEYPQAYFPQFRITAVVIPGYRMGDTGEFSERFSHNKGIYGTIREMLDAATRFVERNMKVKTIIEGWKRNDRTEYPIKAVREAIINALMHRDYSFRGEEVPVQIRMFNDRMEIWNIGGPYGKQTINTLGKERGETRNATLTEILEALGLVENRFSGIPTIRAEMASYNLPEPIFENREGDFVVTLKNGFNGVLEVAEESRDFYNFGTSDGVGTAGSVERVGSAGGVGGAISAINAGSVSNISIIGNVNNTNKANIEDALTEFCNIPRSRKEIADYLGKTQYYAMKKFVDPLIKSGKLKMTLPDKPKSSKQRFYSVIV